MKRKRVMLIAALLVVVIALAWVAGIMVYTALMLRGLLHVHVSARERDPQEYGLVVESKSFASADGVALVGWWVGVPDPKATVILVHGYTRPKGGKPDMLPHAQFLHEAGYNVFLFDLRGFGESAGERVTMGLNEWQDVASAYELVRSLPQTQGKKIGFLGLSMGAATVVNTSGRLGIGDFVILQSPYTRIESLFDAQIRAARLPVWAVRPLVAFTLRLDLGWNYRQFEPVEYASQITVPLLVMEALRDEALPAGEGKKLYELAAGPKELSLVDATHNMHEDLPEEFAAIVLDYLERYAQ